MIIKAQQLASNALSKVGYDREQLGDFSADARTAIKQAPDYFVWWYTAKSIGLGLAVGVIGFLIGRATARR
jgi:ElaB/YqjD/DUF883 family membrane-anchored ribosome-binding protein